MTRSFRCSLRRCVSGDDGIAEDSSLLLLFTLSEDELSDFALLTDGELSEILIFFQLLKLSSKSATPPGTGAFAAELRREECVLPKLLIELLELNVLLIPKLLPILFPKLNCAASRNTPEHKLSETDISSICFRLNLPPLRILSLLFMDVNFVSNLDGEELLELEFMLDVDLDRDTDFNDCLFSSIGGGISSNGFVGIVYD